MKTYITLKTFGKEVKEYAQVVKTKRKENEVPIEETSGSAFFYDQNKLIKVEEFLKQEGKETKVEWHFEDDKCFFNTAPFEKSEDRIPMLLTLSKKFQQTIAGNPNR